MRTKGSGGGAVDWVNENRRVNEKPADSESNEAHKDLLFRIQSESLKGRSTGVDHKLDLVSLNSHRQ